MIFEHLVVGMLQTNCYLLGDTQTRRAVVLDPGGGVDKIVSRVKNAGLNLAAIIITHAHSDHMADAWSLKDRLGGEIIMHPKDRPILQHSMVGMGRLYALNPNSPKIRIDRTIQENDVLEFGALRLKVLETPGHTPGHVSFYFADAGVVFVGDTIFAGSIGRTDFPGGSHTQLIRSVREKIFPLEGSTVVYPGHGPRTTVERERKTNPFFR